MVLREVTVEIAGSPQRDSLEEILEHVLNKHAGHSPALKAPRAAHSAASSTSAVKRNAGFELVPVPRDPFKRMKYFAEQTNSLVQSLVAGSSAVTVSSANFVCIKKAELQDDVASIAGIFMNCIIQFNGAGVSFMLTSFDVFIHNNNMVDDCASGISPHEYHQKPFAVVAKHTYLQSATYFELSIFLGYYEILTTGGYYCKSGGPVIPFLGSSLANWQHDALDGGSILVTGANMKHSVQSSERLLNQYCKRNAHNLWGFHSAATHLRSFTPINPLYLKNHASQRGPVQSTEISVVFPLVHPST
ncbi:hypothetical protein MBANPS3_007883 [Mucor bainieri]